MLEFNSQDHIYTLDGVVVPSVTQCTALLTNYGAIPAHVLQAACDFGTNVHGATELWDGGVLDEEALDPALAPWLAGWKKFKAESGFEIVATELRVHSAKYRYAGMLDRVGVLNGKRVIVDIKTPMVVSPSTGPQTAGYQQAYEELTGDKIKGRFAVQLSPDNYRLIPYKDPNDFNVFISCLNITNFRRKHNV